MAWKSKIIPYALIADLKNNRTHNPFSVETKKMIHILVRIEQGHFLVETIVATGTVDAPIEDVWQPLSTFDDWPRWWPICTNWKATGNDIEAARTFDLPGWNVTSTGKWVARDGAKYFLRHDPVKMEGPCVLSILLKGVTLQEMEILLQTTRCADKTLQHARVTW